MHKDVESILISENDLDEIVTRIAGEITRDYQGREPLILGLLKGSYVFLSDLVRKLSIDCRIDFMSASSYGSGTVTSGKVKLSERSYDVFKDEDVILVEDILDSGRTLFAVKNKLLESGVKSLKICTLLDKPNRREADITADYVGVKIPDVFTVGYGMDYSEKYRQLPYIATLKKEIYLKSE